MDIINQYTKRILFEAAESSLLTDIEQAPEDYIFAIVQPEDNYVSYACKATEVNEYAVNMFKSEQISVYKLTQASNHTPVLALCHDWALYENADAALAELTEFLEEDDYYKTELPEFAKTYEIYKNTDPAKVLEAANQVDDPELGQCYFVEDMGKITFEDLKELPAFANIENEDDSDEDDSDEDDSDEDSLTEASEPEKDYSQYGKKIYNKDTEEDGLLIATWINTYAEDQKVDFATCVDPKGNKYNVEMSKLDILTD